MTFGELLANLLGWLGDFIQWVFNWVPRYKIVKANERGVHYFLGREPIEWEPGAHWFVPNLSEVVKWHNNRMVLYIEPLALEDSEGVPVEVGMVITYHITDVLQFEVANYDADESMHEVAQGALQEIVTSSPWAKMRGKTDDGSRLGKKLASLMGKELSRFGVEVESARPTHQVRLSRVFRLFGVDQRIDVAR